MAPLARGQQLFLQRLLARHVLSDAEAKELFQELDRPAASLQDCFREINFRLTKSFGLEIATVSISAGGERQRFHAIVNQNADDVSKKSFLNMFDPHECAYVRAVLEKLATAEASSRMDLINLRTTLQEPYKMPELKATEHCLDQLLDQGWLALANKSSSRRRESMNVEIELGPRAYLELSSLLTDFGMEEEDLPQLIFYHF